MNRLSFRQRRRGRPWPPPRPRRNQRLRVPIPPWRDRTPRPWRPFAFTPNLRPERVTPLTEGLPKSDTQRCRLFKGMAIRAYRSGLSLQIYPSRLQHFIKTILQVGIGTTTTFDDFGCPLKILLPPLQRPIMWGEASLSLRRWCWCLCAAKRTA